MIIIKNDLDINIMLAADILDLKGRQTGMTRAQRLAAEERRISSIPDLQRIIAGQSLPGEVAKEYEVCATTIVSWVEAYEADSRKILKQTPKGARGNLTDAQLIDLKAIYDAGPQSSGFEEGLWNAARLAQVIKEVFGVDCSETFAKRRMYKWDHDAQKRTFRRAPKLKPRQLSRLKAIYEAGSQSAGFNEELWNAARLMQTIFKIFHIQYSETRAKSLMYEWDPEGVKREFRKTIDRPAAGHLSDTQHSLLKSSYESGARQAGFEDDLWNARRLVQVIKRDFGIDYSETRAKYLMYDWDPEAKFRLHRPAPRKKVKGRTVEA